MTSSNGIIFRLTGSLWPVTGEIPSQRPVTQSFDVSFDMRLNKGLCKQSRHRWFETPWRLSWRHCNGNDSHSIPVFTPEWSVLNDLSQSTRMLLINILFNISFKFFEMERQFWMSINTLPNAPFHVGHIITYHHNCDSQITLSGIAHYGDITSAFQITCIWTVCSTVC